MKKNELLYCSILKTNINVTNMEDTLSYITDNLEELRGKYICVSNVHTTVMSYKDETYRKIQNEAAMALPDGKPLSLVSRRRGFSHADRVPGPDLMPRILELSLEKGYKHYFYGSSQKTLDELKKRLESQYKGLQIVGMYSPPFRELAEEEDNAIINQINTCQPDFVWVALGAPKQERWMYAHRGKINGVMLGVGAAFDFLAGTVERAPEWMQNLCLEWLFRISQDPKRLLKRYLSTNFAFLYYVWKENKTIPKRKKVVMIGHKRIPSREGGVEIVVEQIAVRLAKLGWNVEAYNRYGHHVSGKKYDEDYGRKKRKYYKNIRVRIIPTFQSSKLNAIVYSFLGTLRAMFGKFDVFHYHAEGPCVFLWIPKMFGKRVVATIHGLDWQRSKWGNFASNVLKLGEKVAAKYADEIIVLSKNVQSYFMDTYNRETKYIPNGIERPQKVVVRLIKEKYGLEKNNYILFLARMVPEKGVHYLLEAFKLVETDKKLVIAGGNSQAVEYMDKIRAMAAMDDRVIMTDFVKGQILEELYSNAYIYVLPSDIEGMAISLLEAMSYGNCCLVSDIPENTEVIEDFGVSFRKSNVKDLRDKIEYLLKNPDKVEELQKDSADYICKKYNWDFVVDETLKLYNKSDRK